MRCSGSEKLRKTTATGNLPKKGGEIQYMKLIAIITLAAAAIGLSACAHHEEPAPAPTTTHSSYSK
jgi:hypothetical protein